MQDNHCVNFLQWALPKLNLRWKGFRRVRRQVCRRIDKRIVELQLADIDVYRKYLAENQSEWHILDRMCRITISRFYRDRAVFNYFTSYTLPALIKKFREEKSSALKVWCCGCASGEEPYTVSIIWHNLFRKEYPVIRLEIIATDIDPVLIERAQIACYSGSSIRFLPEEWVDQSFSEENGMYCLKEELKQPVHFRLQDIRNETPEDLFQLVFCRNLAFTYFDKHVQEQVLNRLSSNLATDGILIIGGHESLPENTRAFTQAAVHLPIFIKS